LISKNREVKIIIAPHDLKRVPAIRQLFPSAVLYSEFDNSTLAQFTNAQILIIDCIGLLQKLYFYADVAVVGGGFHTKGLHNILEAAAFGVPVLFGDQFRKNPEADGLIAISGAKCFEDEFFAAPYLIELLRNDELRRQIGENARRFIDSQPNATQAILSKILS
jgi:3-deoxy-D-manno-octulosonic-acid transferase